MEFITQGNRIAVEFFDKGKLYTVLWKNDTQENLMCISIGADCVVFQGEAPINLFTLSMRNADTIDSIEPTQLGTTNYNNLINKPQINGVDLIGNKTGAQLGLASQSDLEDYATNASVVAGLATKQDALSSSQLQAVNSGITSELVTQIGTNTSAIAGKQDALSSSQLQAVNSGITSSLVTQIGTNENNILLENNTITYSDIMFADNTMSQYISTDTDGSTIATITATDATNIYYTSQHDTSPNTVLNVEIWAKTTKVRGDDGSTQNGSAIDIRFFDKNNAQIGDKYSMEVCTTERYGYHKYQCVAPKCAAYYIARHFVRKNTTVSVKKITIKTVDVMPMIDSDSVIYDCHLGCLLYAPRNTWSAYEMAKQMGFKNLIINVKRTSDNKLVCIHDATIDATSDGTGAVSSYTYEQLLQYDFGSWFNTHYTGEKIPLCDDVLQYIATCGMNVIFSIHDTNSTSDIDDLYSMCTKYSLKPYIKTYDYTQIEYAYSKFGDNCNYIWIRSTALTDNQKTWISTFGHLSYIEFDVYSVITAENVAECKTLGCDVIGGISKQPDEIKKAIANGATRFTSDMCSDMVC